MHMNKDIDPRHRRKEQQPGQPGQPGTRQQPGEGGKLSSMARDSTLSVVRHLETTLEEQGLALIEARQASIGATMKAREQLRRVEEDLCHRNRRISMLQSALRQRASDQEMKLTQLHNTVRELRSTSDLHVSF
jgi:hypothetical protein